MSFDLTTAGRPEGGDPIGIRTAYRYALLCVLMLAVSASAYGAYLDQQVKERRAQEVLLSELRPITEKKGAVIVEAQQQLTALQQEIAALPVVPGVNKAGLAARANSIDVQLNAARMDVDTINRVILTYQRTSGVTWLTIVDRAWAETNDVKGVPMNVKLFFAIAAFVVIIILMGYCLWMIARSNVSQPDKQWAKNLLNHQLVFLGGVVGGIILK